MTHAPLPAWVERIRRVIDQELKPLGLSVGVCWIPRKGRVEFKVAGVTTLVSTVLDVMRRAITRDEDIGYTDV